MNRSLEDVARALSERSGRSGGSYRITFVDAGGGVVQWAAGPRIHVQVSTPPGRFCPRCGYPVPT